MPETHPEQSEAVTEREAVMDEMQIDGAVEPGSLPSHGSGVSGTSAVLDDSTIQQHSKMLTARLQSQLDHGRADGLSESEPDVEQALPLPANFKATLVDSSGPIPGLEDV